MREHYPDIKLSVSCTTRARRRGEVNGRDYHFVSKDRFVAMRGRRRICRVGESPRYFITAHRANHWTAVSSAGQDILLDIDVQGARKIKSVYPDAVSVFLLPPSRCELERRLKLRGTDDAAVIRRRLANAQDEIRRVIQYDYYIVNRNVEAAVEALQSIIEAERAKTARVSRVGVWNTIRAQTAMSKEHAH